MTNIYQEIWDADMRGNGLKAVNKKEEGNPAAGFVVVRDIPVTDPEEQRNHCVFQEVVIPEHKQASYRLVEKLFDNYTLNQKHPEPHCTVEALEVKEFLLHAIASEPMRLCRRFIERKRGPFSDQQWYDYLHEIWFLHYDTANGVDLTGFEHVFVGEQGRKKELGGHHFWYKYYLEDQAGENDQIIYLGPKGKNPNTPDIVIIAYQIEAIDDVANRKVTLYKEKNGFFVGLSAEGLLALATVRFSYKSVATINQVRYRLHLHKSPDQRSIRTFFPVFLAEKHP
ncbi:hypothetical protein [Laceyella putida]|uniref:EndoU domain-containing protein n=1 Tax=Laceyella putida TaxID=110101 RepID=A0ABW2RIC7_9BACL